MVYRALSRSKKNILHIDPNPYYGGAEAALSLAEVDEWAAARPDATSTRVHAPAGSASGPVPALGRLSAYSIALAPQFLHARSALVDLLVSSRAFRQLEFLAVSSFFVLDASSLVRIPATREDVFATTAMPARSKRQLMKFLKFVLAWKGDADTTDEVGGAAPWKEHASEPLGSYLTSTFGLDDRLRDNILALALSLDGASIPVAEGLARLHRHITSMGVFGAGFAAVYPKWGGCGEVVQVACRAAAVGGATYMLGSGIRSVTFPDGKTDDGEEQDQLVEVELTQDMTVKTRLLVRGSDDVDAVETPSALAHEKPERPEQPEQQQLSRLVAIVGSPLPFLFAPTVEGAPVAGGAVIALPAGRPLLAAAAAPEHPVFVMAHSSDTGECPPGQSESFFFIFFLSLLPPHAHEAQ